MLIRVKVSFLETWRFASKLEQFYHSLVPCFPRDALIIFLKRHTENFGVATKARMNAINEKFQPQQVWLRLL